MYRILKTVLNHVERTDVKLIKIDQLYRMFNLMYQSFIDTLLEMNAEVSVFRLPYSIIRLAFYENTTSLHSTPLHQIQLRHESSVIILGNDKFNILFLLGRRGVGWWYSGVGASVADSAA